MIKSIFAAAVALVLLSGCTIRHLQPPQYGTQIVQQVKVLGTKVSVPSGTGTGGVLQFYLGYVTETVLVIPVTSNVHTNGDVDPIQPKMVAAPLSTTFGVSDTSSAIKLNDNIVSGYEDHNENTVGTVMLRKLTNSVPPSTTANRIGPTNK